MSSPIRYRESPTGLVGLQRLTRLLDEAFGGWPGQEQGTVLTSAWYAPTDVCEDGNSLQITVEVPGVRPEDVKISLENNILSIRGEKRQQSEENTEQVHRYERNYGVFERTFALPSTVDPEKIEARHENGILTITIPKAERARPREIPVSTGAAQAQAGQGGTPAGGTQAEVGTKAQVETKGTGDRAKQQAGDRDAEEEGSAGKPQR